jgi:hypothetical protein
MLATHKGASETVYKYVTGQGRRMAINGSIHVILNNKQNTVFFEPSGADTTSKISGKKSTFVDKDDDNKVKSKTIKDFTYLTLKERGKPMTSEKKVMKDLFNWVVENIPKSDFQKALSKDK